MRAVRKMLVVVVSMSVGVAPVLAESDADLASLPEQEATLVVFTNSDIPDMHSAGQIAYDVTSIATPGNLYEVGPKPPELLKAPGD